jgi:hypothetical protein
VVDVEVGKRQRPRVLRAAPAGPQRPRFVGAEVEMLDAPEKLDVLVCPRIEKRH